MAAKKSETASADDFESSMTELENIVSSLEDGELSLSEMMTHYERGSVLLKKCDSILKDARARLEKINSNSVTPSQVDLLDLE